MYPKCSLSDSNIYLQIVGLLSLVIIMIIAGFYYMRVCHSSITEKYEAVIYKTPGELQAGNRSTFPKDKYPGARYDLVGTTTTPTTTDNYELRDCKVYFTNDTGACDGKGDNGKTCSYKYDGWQEFATYTDKNGNKIEYPKKIYTQDASNTDALINSYFTSKCFKKFDNNGDGRAQPFEYIENNLVKYDSKGSTNNPEIDTNVFGGKKYTSMQFLNSTSSGDNLNNVIESICSIRYNPIKELVGKKFYKFVLDANKNITQILKVELNSDQTTFAIINNNAVLDFSFLGSHGLKFVSANSDKLEVFITSADIVRPVNVYRFSYVSYICPSTTKAQITSFLKTSTKINITNFIRFGGANANAISANNPFTLDDIDRLTASKYTTANTDYKTAMLNELADKRDERVTALNGVSSAAKDALDKKITDKDAEIFTADTTRNSYYIPEGTFKKVIDLTKANTKIFNYNNGYNNTNLSKLVIPTGCEVIMENSGDVCFVFKNKGANQTSYNFSVPERGYTCDILLVGGGGGGGMNAGAGGGAGGFILLEKTTLSSGTYTIKVGDGGAGGTTSAVGTAASNGFNSTFGTYTAIGGGAGVNSGGSNGNTGGSGGGAGNDWTGNRSGGAGTAGQGFKGGDGTVPGGWERTGGGGGGARTQGQSSVSTTRAGDGGVGINLSSIFGTSVGQSGWFAGGGGGGVHSGTGGTGGIGGGGSENVEGINGTGGGGGAARNGSGAGRRGGSGIVIIRIKNILQSPDINSAIDIYYSIDSITDISLASNTIQTDIITAFVFLQKGYYRFRADLGTNTNGANPSIKYAHLMIYDESNFDRSTSKYRCVPVFRYKQLNPTYLKQYVYIPTSKFFKIAYFYISHNPTATTETSVTSPFKMYYDYSAAPQQQTYPEDIVSSPSVSSNTISNTDKFMIFTYTGDNTGTGQTLYNLILTEELICDILIVGGGGGGGMNAGAGGGAGGLVLLQNTTLSTGTYTVRVGDGGNGGTTWAAATIASNGKDSIFGTYTAIGGGAGVNSGGINGNSGGSGGGSGNATDIQSGNRLGGAGTLGQGFKGGNGTIPGGYTRTGGGGGGAGGEGQASISTTRAGDGGIGRNMSSIFGTSVGQSGWFAGGGGGGVHSGTGGMGGSGGGGNENVDGVNGTGGGGGAGRSPNVGRKGGSGTVIIRYRLQSQQTSGIQLKDLNDNMNDAENMYVSNNITNNIKTSMNDYLYYSLTLYNDYKNTDTTVMDIFSIMNYTGNNKVNYRYLATYLNNKVDYFNTDKLIAEKKEFQRQLQTHIDTSSTTITGDQEIIKIDNLSNNIKAINYNEKKPMNAPILKNVPIKDIFCESNNNIYLTYDTITNLNGINLLTPNLTPAIYIEAIT